jgi:hypothetical protein
MHLEVHALDALMPTGQTRFFVLLSVVVITLFPAGPEGVTQAVFEEVVER